MPSCQEISSGVEKVRQSLYDVMEAFDFNNSDISAGDALTELESAVETCCTVKQATTIVKDSLTAPAEPVRRLVVATESLWDQVAGETTQPPERLAHGVERVRQALYRVMEAFDFNDSDISAGDALLELYDDVREATSAGARTLVRGLLRRGLAGPLPAARRLAQDLHALGRLLESKVCFCSIHTLIQDVVVISMPTRRSMLKRRRCQLMKTRKVR